MLVLASLRRNTICHTSRSYRCICICYCIFSIDTSLSRDIVRQWNEVMEGKMGGEEVRTVLCAPPSPGLTVGQGKG